jgi:hypothetical protein
MAKSTENQALYWTTIALAIVSTILGTTALFLHLSADVGLSNTDRTMLVRNGALLLDLEQRTENITEALQPVNQTLQNTTVVLNELQNEVLPSVEACHDALQANVPPLQMQAQDKLEQLIELQSGLAARFAGLQPKIDQVTQSTEQLAMSVNETGIVQEYQTGIFIMVNDANATLEQSPPLEYTLKSITLGSAELFFIEIPPSSEWLRVDTVGPVASVRLTDWTPPVLAGVAPYTGLVGVPTTDHILDRQRLKIGVAPSGVLFEHREYDDVTGDIVWSAAPGVQFTSGDIVQVVDFIEMNIGFL